jgi:hypothetical protein
MFLIGLLCDAQSCYVITVFRVTCCTLNVSAAGLLTQGVATASINFDLTFLLNFPSNRCYELRHSPSQVGTEYIAAEGL